MKNKKIIIVCLIVIVLLAFLFFALKPKEDFSGKYIRLTVKAATLRIKLYNNPSAEAFYEKLKDGNLKVIAVDNGGFEKVAKLDYTLPTSDEVFTAKAGDVVLYQGNKVAIFYGKNNYNYTKLGKIESTNASYLKSILGSGEVTLDFSL
jgi:hypothetical protein